MHFSRFLKAVCDSEAIKRAGQTRRPEGPESRDDGKVQTENRAVTNRSETGIKPMARFEITMSEMAMMGGNGADALCELGVNYATGRGCAADLVAANKWLNIAAIRGNARAAELRADVAATLTKMQLAAALRAAREWMTTH